MIGVSVESGAICERRDETRVVRARQKQRVRTDCECLHFRNHRRERAQAVHVFFARRLFDVSTILPDHDMCQHVWTSLQSSSETQPKSQGDGAIAAGAAALAEEEVI